MKNLKKKDIFLHLIFFVAGSCVSLSIYIHIEPCVIKHVEPATQMVAPIVLAAREQKICARKNDTMLTLKKICMDDIYNYVDGRSPVSYPAHGLYVMPLRAVLIKGLRIEWFIPRRGTQEEKVEFRAEKGVFTTLCNYENVYIEGKETKRMTIRTNSPSLLNLQLQDIVYRNTEFDTNIFEKVLLRYLEFNITIPIHIQHRQVPWLYRKGTVEERVTVIVKTFLRYHKAKSAIYSIKRLYPNTRIIIADDTPPTNFTNLQGINMDHFRMPGFTGYFAGRNLGLSQVWTEYFLYMDDDLYFTNGTRLDVLVSFLDKTNFHLVSGAAEGKKRHVHTLRVLGNGTYSCHRKEQRHYQEIKGFPGCFVADLVPNFFLGSTHEVKSIGFDPHPALSRVGHYAFFLSALGRIRIAFCTTVEFGHNKTTTEADAAYRSFRYVGPEYYKMRGHHELFKYNFAC
ncbi:PREDICTED: beta-1,4 N-acetylgalactosaminyltransferase 1-like isoform X2 [Branchiostoma belcheri]|uniref:Beta-1,4 N-acetylgalactosaminyltransferase 1-like isoform X2 n=1 Tax=Branchiostoma belcheri TaxID=7741 RepID=A0A6P4YKQ9_BRABE|nr:PREDICTED: beta-1,4 N-acetylgalactosaminyltransferase 1-like isoform X2 [Branchiostoma belcheri]